MVARHEGLCVLIKIWYSFKLRFFLILLKKVRAAFSQRQPSVEVKMGIL